MIQSWSSQKGQRFRKSGTKLIRQKSTKVWKVGHFTSKCPYPTDTPEDEKYTRKIFKKKPFYKKTTTKGIRTFT